MNIKKTKLSKITITATLVAVIAYALVSCGPTSPTEETSATREASSTPATAQALETTSKSAPGENPHPAPPYLANMYGELPTLHLTMSESNEIPPFTDRETWLNCSATMTSANPEFEFENLRTRIRGRGRSSWSRAAEKRSVRLRFRDGDRHMLDSSYAHRDWVLVANHTDNSLLRNYTAYHLGGLLTGMDWSPFARSLHLYVDGEYMGVYLLADERNIAPGRGVLNSDPDPAVSEYFIEMDWRLFRNDNVQGVDYFRINTHERGISGVSANQGVPEGYERDRLYEVRFPRPNSGDFSVAHVEYARQFVEDVSRAIRNKDWQRITELVDMASMVDYYLVQELFKNVDTGWSSQFMQIRAAGENHRLYMGPIWDFDVAAGNISWMSNKSPEGLYVRQQNYWFKFLLEITEFRALVHERWETFAHAAVLETIAHTHALSQEFAEDFQRNFERHKVLGVDHWPKPPEVIAIDTFEGQVEFMIDFLSRRAASLSEIYGGFAP
ncbi:MAG: CotH kinase family protein [Oscillospiraceae bacterium]|nr:CotH kinase family protein [Oscillospiraceae bacterium]